MPNLYDILADAQHGDAMAELGQQFGLTPQQTEAAVAALLPAISVGLKQSTATPEGLGNLFALMAQRPDLFAMYDDPKAAFREGHIKPVIVGLYKIDVPGRPPSGDGGHAQAPGGDVLGQILRDVLGGMTGQGKNAGLSNNVGAAVFGDRSSRAPMSTKVSWTASKTCSTASWARGAAELAIEPPLG
jgi:hypothetical protein